jgi:hypothetical protein
MTEMSRFPKTSSWLTLALLASLSGACGSSHNDGGSTDAGSSSGVFIAFASDFANFRSWQSFDVTIDEAVDAGLDAGGVHPDAKLIEYLNKPPPSGSTEFPVGTIIVKEGTDGPVYMRQYFAMVKRGGTENAAGAKGWEWFELQNAADGTPGIRWRGVGPPNGELYGGDPTGGCNSCHVKCGNDAVCAKAVQLAQF